MQEARCPHDPLHHPPPPLRDTHPHRDQLHRLRAPRPGPQRPDRTAPAHHSRRKCGLRFASLSELDSRFTSAISSGWSSSSSTSRSTSSNRRSGWRSGIRASDCGCARGRREVRWWTSSSSAMPQTLWVVGLSYIVGDPHRHPHRHRLRLPAVLVVRPGRHLRVHGGVLGADVLHRPARDHHLQRDAAVAAVHLRHYPQSDGSRELLGASQAAHHAGDGAGAVQRGAAQPLHALRDARQPEPRLCAHRSRQGHARAHRAARPRAAQQHDSGGDPDRARHPPPSSAAPSSPSRSSE